jgi:tRNA(fMet)-specific endonuclease VapC
VSFLIDTDICSAYLKGDGRVFNRFLQHSGGINVSAITLAELYSWALRAKAPPGRLVGVAELLSEANVLPVDRDVARRFGEVRASLLDRGHPIATPDLLIASTAILHDLTVVTHNTAHFAPVAGLRVEDWLAP